MLYDQHNVSPSVGSTSDRRLEQRFVQAAEVVIAWLCPALPPVRYTLLDLSDGGIRIRTSVPLATGMVGKVLRLLPAGRVINETVSVVWTRPSTLEGMTEVGLRFQAPS